MSAVVASDELPVARASELRELDAGHRWLVHDLWGIESVGFIGGAPKCAKTWLGLDIAVSVASGTPCLGRFAVDATGPALVYLAEDALPQVRERIVGLVTHRGLALDTLDLHVITAPTVRLDVPRDQQRLEATVARLHPKLLLLDPLVRLHRIDENSSADISALLGFLRELSRRHALAIVLVHHMSKRSRAEPGQALRGSSDLHAFGDDNAYLIRHHDRLQLLCEHRSAPAGIPMDLRLASNADGTGAHLEIVDDTPSVSSDSPPLAAQIVTALGATSAPQQRAALRRRLRVNNLRLGEALQELEGRGRIRRDPAGWSLVPPA